MNTVEQVKQAAVRHFLGVLPSSAGDNGMFRSMSTMHVGGENKPLLLVGNAHSRVEDGHCIAILNPDQELIDKIHAGCAYSSAILKEIVAKRCDLALDVWIDAYKADGIYLGPVYKSRNPKPAKFVVQ